MGNTIVLAEGYRDGITAVTNKFPERSISSPKAQRTLKGPDIGFNESISANTALMRKIIRDSSLRIEDQTNINSNTMFKYR
ncbi:spore germination protein [Bacillus sp. PAMC26568]|nr:spore germination protein [Bacillus sp. PAMC26568]